MPASRLASVRKRASRYVSGQDSSAIARAILANSTSATGSESLIVPDDMPPFELIKESGKAQIVICSDHAAGTVPQALATLGMDPSEFDGYEEYERRVRILVEVGLVEDATVTIANRARDNQILAILSIDCRNWL